MRHTSGAAVGGRWEAVRGRRRGSRPRPARSIAPSSHFSTGLDTFGPGRRPADGEQSPPLLDGVTAKPLDMPFCRGFSHTNPHTEAFWRGSGGSHCPFSAALRIVRDRSFVYVALWCSWRFGAAAHGRVSSCSAGSWREFRRPGRWSSCVAGRPDPGLRAASSGRVACGDDIRGSPRSPCKTGVFGGVAHGVRHARGRVGRGARRSAVAAPVSSAADSRIDGR
jgi:hypothetical protein